MCGILYFAYPTLEPTLRSLRIGRILVNMLTSAECITNVVRMELQAIALPRHRDEYRQLAAHWQWLANTATSHEAYEDRGQLPEL